MQRNLLKMKKFQLAVQHLNSRGHLMLTDTAMIPVLMMLTCDRWRSQKFTDCLQLEMVDHVHVQFIIALLVCTEIHLHAVLQSCSPQDRSLCHETARDRNAEL